MRAGAKKKTAKMAAATTTAKPPKRAPGRPRAVPDESLVLARGLETFAELGFEGTSVRELARRLGVSHNFINDRYGTKEGFWRAVVDDSLRDFGAAVDGVLSAPGVDDLQRLRAVVATIADLAGPRPHLQQMLNFEATRGSPRLLYIFERYIQPFTLTLTPVIASLVRAGLLRPVPWHVLFFLLTAPGTASGQRPLAELLGRPRHEESSGPLFTELILTALRLPPAPPP